ncbi:MAG: hydroxymethylglutaryl-CoA synthase, partial [Deltaproteobacteria bacterium]
MRAGRAVGILGYGAYVPRFRLPTRDIAAVWRATGGAAPPVAEKSVPGPDEDVVTMAIEAGRTALARAGGDPASVGAVWVGSESKPYAVKPSATIVAEALGVTPHVVAADMEFACKAGSEAMQAAV